MLAVTQRGDRLLGVVLITGQHEDRLEVRLGDQLFGPRIAPRHAIPLSIACTKPGETSQTAAIRYRSAIAAKIGK